MSRSTDHAAARLSALVDADTQFDLDLSDLLDQFPDGAARGAGGAVVPIPAPTHRDETPAVTAREVAPAAVAIVPLGDPWVVAPRPSSPRTDPAVADPSQDRRGSATPFGAVVAAAAAAERHPVPPAAAPVEVEPPAVAVAVAGAPVAAGRTAVDTAVPVAGVAATGPAPAVPAGVTDVDLALPTPGIAPTTVDPAVAAAVNPPTSVHPVFVTPPAGTPVVGPPIVPASPPGTALSGPDRRSRRRARRRTLTVTVLAGVLAVALVAGGVGLAFATRDGGGGDAAVTSPGGAVALPPPEAQKPADDADPGAVADEPGTGDDAIALARAADAVTTFLSVRGTEAERAVSSQAGRAELDGVLTALGATSAQGAPACTAVPAGGTFACVLDTDRGPVTFTVGPDADDPASSGFEVIGAAA